MSNSNIDYAVGLERFKAEAIDSIEEFAEGFDDMESYEGFAATKTEIKKAKNFDEVAAVLINEFGYDSDMIIEEYQNAISRK